MSISVCQADIYTSRKHYRLAAIRYTTRIDGLSIVPFSKWIFIGQSYCIYRAQSAFCRHARRFSQNESFVITRKAVSSLRLGLTRTSASINVVFGIRSRNVERNCAPSIITTSHDRPRRRKRSLSLLIMSY